MSVGTKMYLKCSFISNLFACKAHFADELAGVKSAVSISGCYFQCVTLPATGQCVIFPLALALARTICNHTIM